MIGGRVLDVTAIVGFSTGQSVYAEALVMTAIEENIVLVVPSAALAQRTSPGFCRPCNDMLDEHAHQTSRATPHPDGHVPLAGLPGAACRELDTADVFGALEGR